MEQIECSETSAYKIETPGNYPKDKRTIFRTRLKFEIKDNFVYVCCRKSRQFRIESLRISEPE